MPIVETQSDTFLAVSAAGDTTLLLLQSVEGTEAISQLFRFSLTMHSHTVDIDPKTIVGKPLSVTMKVGDAPERYLHGIVSRFLQSGASAGLSVYTAELVPSMWLLTLGRDRRIWRALTVPDIITKLLQEFGITATNSCTGTYPQREYCIQHDESPFDFISRLMEEEGIFYFFTFESGAHKLTIADASDAFADCPDAAALEFSSPRERETIHSVTRFDAESRLVVKGHELGDYDYLKPSTPATGKNEATTGAGKQYEYSVGFLASATDARAKIRVEADQVQSETARGVGHAYALMAGTKFTLSGHPNTALNAAHVVRAVSHSAGHGFYSNSFETFPVAVPFRPPRVTPRPRVIGSQVAKVVGNDGEEIWADKYGRINVKFPWDRGEKPADYTTCKVRVAQTWAGQTWGAFFMPRIGQEVIISFVDGDPDRPLVTGSVYNADNMPPIDASSLPTQSTIKSRSSKSGAAGNEIRFEDKKDSEEFYFHAQKDMKVEIENMLTTTVKASHEIHTLEKGDRTVDVQTGKEVHKVKGTREVTVTGNETHTNEADFTHNVKGKYTLKVTGDLVIDVTGSITIKTAAGATYKAGTTIDIDAGTALTAKAGMALTNKAGTDLAAEAGMGMKLKASTTLDAEAAMVTVKASATGTIDGGGMLTVKGGLVKIN